MSVETTVILEKNKLPSPMELQKFISEEKFELSLDTNFTWDEHEGFLRCSYKGQPSGFELYTSSYTPSELVEELVTPEESILLQNRAYLVTFVTHSNVIDALSAHLVYSCLTKISDGFLLENSEPPFLSANEAYLKVHGVVEEFQDMM